MGYRLSVDIGTTFTAAATSDVAGPTMIGLGNRALQIPSVLFLTDSDTFVVGEAAERRGLQHPERVVREFKRRLGDSVPIIVDGLPFAPQTLTARLLHHVVGVARDRMGGAAAEVVLTHPANWGPFKLEVLDQVAELAGVGPITRCPEPLAAAAQYAAQTRVDEGSVIAVYDLGGGTFDVCVLRKDAGGFTVLGSPSGIEQMGGIDFDNAIFRHVVSSLGDVTTTLDPDDPDTSYGLARLRLDCVEAKEALSTDIEAAIRVALPSVSTTVRLTRGEVEEMIRPALRESVGALGRTLRSARVAPDQLSAIVLIGGSSRIPLVTELLQDAFQAVVAVDTHPKHDVALGAVRLARPHSASTSSPEPVAHAGPTTPPVDPPRAPEDPEALLTRRPPRRGRVVGVAAAILVVVLVAVGLVALRRDATTTASTATGLPLPSPTLRELPTSRPLTATELVVSMKDKDGTSDLYLADTEKAAPVRHLTTSDWTEGPPVISPSRQTMIYVAAESTTSRERILRVAGAADLSGDRQLLTLPPECRAAIRPAWNLVDPSILAVPCITTDDTYALWLMRTDGTILRRVETPAGLPRIGDPAFSPDGRTLGFLAQDGSWDGGVLVTVPVVGGSPQPLLAEAPVMQGQDADMVWSPDGQYIAFRRRLSAAAFRGQYDIFRVRSDGSQLEQLTTDPQDQQDPSWSPSGQQLAYKSAAASGAWPGNTPRVWVMNADGTDQHVLWTADAAAEQGAPSWGPR